MISLGIGPLGNMLQSPMYQQASAMSLIQKTQHSQEANRSGKASTPVISLGVGPLGKTLPGGSRQGGAEVDAGSQVSGESLHC